MNERIKELRTVLGLSGEKFGEQIGLKRSAISLIENGKTSITDQVIKSICLAYNVNEDWLRTGEGEMFIKTRQTYLDDLQRRHNLSDFDVKLMESYLSLTPQDRESIEKLVTSCLENPNNEEI